MKKQIMRIDEVNRNRRSYSKECVEEAIKNWPKNGMPGRIGMQENIEIGVLDYAFLAHKPEIVDNRLIVDIQILETPAGKILTALEENKFGTIVYVTNGTGKIELDQVEDFRINSISVIPIEDSSWELGEWEDD